MDFDRDRLSNTLGAHEREDGSVVFRVYAPNADAVRLTGDFCDFGEGLNMRRDEDGVYSCTLSPGMIKKGDFYGFAVEKDGKRVLKNDPFATALQPHSLGSSCFSPPSPFAWSDDEYLKARRLCCAEEGNYGFPVHVYEVHLGSFHRDLASYRAAAAFFADYLPEMGFTHIELLPIIEHPYGGSWGYQALGFYAPSARYGEAQDLMAFVDTLHKAGIGVIFDLPLAHFPKDEKGLVRFDGTPLFEYADPARAYIPEWDTLGFNLGSDFVRAFLIGACLNLVEVYHADGIRIDAVSAILYRDYGRKEGEWTRGEDGSNISAEGVSFLRALNRAVAQEHSDVLMIAEESTAFPLVTAPIASGGLGFSMKWNMGWANDIFSYLEIDPFFRKHRHDALTFPIWYADSERFLLPVSHDEVVYGKRSLFSKMWGEDALKEATFRVFYTWMLSFPGKKLTFMGTEYGQRNEWNFNAFLDFELLIHPMHRRLHDFVKRANHFYLNSPALYEMDYAKDGFAWFDAEGREENAVSFFRFAKDGGTVFCAFSFAGGGTFEIPLPRGRWRVLFDASDDEAKGQIVSRSLTRTAPYALLLSPLPLPKTKSKKEETP